MYHETYWIAVSAAAPVIALSAIVAMADVGAISSASRQWQIEHPPWTCPEESQELANKIGHLAWDMLTFAARLAWFCMALQATVLAFSLSSLAGRIDEMPTWVAIAGEVASIVALSGVARNSITARYSLDDLKVLTIKVPDEYEWRGQGKWYGPSHAKGAS